MKQAIILAALLWLTPGMVAAKCAGEASFALRECSCTVVNRLHAGWSEYRVLDAYYAPSVAATPEQVAAVAEVMEGRAACDPGLYFMWSREDVRWLGYEVYTPALVVTDGVGREVRFYGRWFRRSQ